jgi:Zn finger protein HypA/HybF involved in hydrogenase expression
MHDFHLANEIVKIAGEEARKNGLLKITKVVVELGDIVEHGESISSENLKYNINLLMPDLKVQVRRIKGNTWKLKEIEGEKN